MKKEDAYMFEFHTSTIHLAQLGGGVHYIPLVKDSLGNVLFSNR